MLDLYMKVPLVIHFEFLSYTFLSISAVLY